MEDHRTILLIEDNPMDLDLTMRAFARRNLTNKIVIARDGQEALDLIASWGIDRPRPVVILLDMNLPKVSGLEVLRQLRSNPAFKTIPVVMLTSSNEDKDIQAAYALGANSYIVKPVDFDQFLVVAKNIEVYWMLINKRPADLP